MISLILAALVMPQEGQVFDQHRKYLEAQASLANVPAEVPQQETVERLRGPFRMELLKAMRQARRQGTLSRRDFRVLFRSSYSPSFLREAEELALTQMAFSDSENVPRKDDGSIDRAEVEWGDGSFLEFLIAFLPYLIQLLIDFGIIGGE